MVNLTEFKLPLQKEIPAETLKFTEQFKGHTTFVGATKASTQRNSIFTNYVGTIEERYNELQNLNELGHSIYFTVNETAPSGRKMKDLESIRAIFADDDEPRLTPKKFPLEPSIIVQTSEHKGKFKHQYYWLTETEDYETWELVMEGIIKVYDMDPGAKDLARLLRVPGFLNHKYDPPSPCKLVKCSGILYHWSEIIHHFPPLPKEARTGTDKILSGGTFNEHAHFQAFLNASSIAPSMNSLIAHWAHHYSAVKIKKKLDQLFLEIPQELRKQEQDRYYAAAEQIDKFIKSAKQAVAEIRAKKNLIQMPVKIRPLLASAMVDFTPIPKAAIPDVLYDVSVAANNYLGNGIEPSLITSISSASILLNKNVRINEIGETTTTFCTTGIVLAMVTGSRKTQIFKIIGKPIIDYESTLREQWEQNKNGLDSQKYMLEQQIEFCEGEIKKAAKKGSGLNEMKTFGESRAKLLDQLDQLQIERPSIYVQDTTEAAVVDVMSKNQGTIAVYTDEGRNFIKNVLGRFESQGGDSAEGWVTNGMGGRVLKTNRKGGGELIIEDPCLNILAMIQPDKATEFKDHKAYKESGMAARLPVYHYPVDDIKMMEQSDRKRLIEQVPLNAYYNVMKELCVQRSANPLIIEISEHAQDRVNAFNDRVVHLLKTTWDRDTNRTNKIITQAVVLGTIMAAVDDPEFRIKLQSDPAKGMRYTLNAKYINMGCLYAEALYEGMLKSTDSLDNISLQRDAISFAKSLVVRYDEGKIYEGFSNNSYLQQKFKSMTKENRDGVIEMLVDHGWLSVTKSETSSELNMGFPGGKANPGDTIYHLNKDEVINQITLQDQADKAENKHYTK